MVSSIELRSGGAFRQTCYSGYVLVLSHKLLQNVNELCVCAWTDGDDLGNHGLVVRIRWWTEVYLDCSLARLNVCGRCCCTCTQDIILSSLLTLPYLVLVVLWTNVYLQQVDLCWISFAGITTLFLLICLIVVVFLSAFVLIAGSGCIYCHTVCSIRLD